MIRSLLSLLFILAVAGLAAQPGTPDATYAVDGWAVIPEAFGVTCEGRAIALAADGSSYLVGDCSSAPDIRVVHLDVNGQMDTTYGDSGFADIDVPGASMDDEERGTAVQPDGKLLIGGSTYGVGGDAFTLLRLLPDGTLDTAFATNGVARFNFSANDDQANGLLLLNSGKILLYGYTEGGGGPDPLVARFNPDGSLDTDFNGTGYNQVNVPAFTAHATDAVEMADGRVVICGDRSLAASVDAFAVRLQTTGVIDPGFPVRTYSFGDGSYIYGNGIDVKADGRYVLTGEMSNSFFDLFALGLAPDGVIDSTFGVDGAFRSTAVEYSEMVDVQCSALDGSCRLIGHGFIDDTMHVVVAKITDNGQLDASYGVAGISANRLADSYNYGYASTVQTDGKLLIAGAQWPNFMFALRLDDDITTALPPQAPTPSPTLDLRFDAAANAWWLIPPAGGTLDRFELIDALGRSVRVQRSTAAGAPILLATYDLAPGSYSVNARWNGELRVGRMVVGR